MTRFLVQSRVLSASPHAYSLKSHYGKVSFFLTRADGTTAAERFFEQKPWSMFAATLASVEIPPAPHSPPRRAVG